MEKPSSVEISGWTTRIICGCRYFAFVWYSREFSDHYNNLRFISFAQTNVCNACLPGFGGLDWFVGNIRLLLDRSNNTDHLVWWLVLGSVRHIYILGPAVHGGHQFFVSHLNADVHPVLYYRSSIQKQRAAHMPNCCDDVSNLLGYQRHSWNSRRNFSNKSFKISVYFHVCWHRPGDHNATNNDDSFTLLESSSSQRFTDAFGKRIKKDVMCFEFGAPCLHRYKFNFPFHIDCCRQAINFWKRLFTLQLNKANTSDKETSFLDLNIKVIGSDIHTSVYDKRDDFGFPIVNQPWLSGDVPRLPSYGIYISQLVRFARCCTSVLDFHSKNLQITSKLLTQGYRYHKLRKTFGKFFRSYSEPLSKFCDISFQEYLSKGISHPVFYGDLVYKLRRVKDTPNFISSGSKIVKRLRRRQYDPVIIETTIGLVLGPCTDLS